MAKNKPAEEFFYLDENGSKQDENLHGPILRAVDFPIDKKISEKHRAKYLAEQKAQALDARRKRLWRDIKERAKRLLTRVYDESQHPRDDRGRWTDSGGFEFVSPNVRNDLDFKGAVQALDSDQQKMLREASSHINRELDQATHEYDIVGAWADGAENSVMGITEKGNWDKLVLSAAMKGHLADQKQVLVFQNGKGNSALYSFEADGDLGAIHQQLLQQGLAFHTLVPRAGGAQVYVVDPDLSQSETVKQAANGAEITTNIGRAEFVGTQKQDGSDREQRDDARRVYEEIIQRSPVQGSDGLWQGVRDRWGASAEQAVGDTVVGNVDISQDMTRGTADKHQPVKSLEELYARSRAAEPEFKREIESIAKETGGTAKFALSNDAEGGTTLKRLSSTQRKIRDEYNGDFTMVKDVLRATVVHDTVEKSRRAAAQFIAEHGDKIMRVKDRFLSPAEGYRDLMMNFVTADGMIAEVQFNTGKLLDAKRGAGHQYYERQRVLRGQVDRGEIDIEEANFLFDLLTDKAYRVYNNAYNASGNGKGWHK